MFGLTFQPDVQRHGHIRVASVARAQWRRGRLFGSGQGGAGEAQQEVRGRHGRQRDRRQLRQGHGARGGYQGEPGQSHRPTAQSDEPGRPIGGRGQQAQ